ncbi:MAG: hypothetical protein VCA36_00280 [Opitutales bacterium]
MKVLLFTGFVVAVLLAFHANDLLGAAPKKNSQVKVQQGKNSKSNKQNSKGRNSQNQKPKTGRATGQATANNQLMAKQLAYRMAFSKIPKGARVAGADFKSGSAPKGSFTELCSLRWIQDDRQAKALEQQRKQVAEQKRKLEEAAAKRSKELQQHKKKRNELRFADLKKEISGSAGNLGNLEQRLERMGKKCKSLNEAIGLTVVKANGDALAGLKSRLNRMKSELNAHAEGADSLRSDLGKVKAACSKWKGSGGSGKDSAPSATALVKMEEEALQIKRDYGRVEFELRKAETYYKDSVKALFFCVSELVRSGASFSSEEKDTIRTLSTD